jgi:hypothetical protein
MVATVATPARFAFLLLSCELSALHNIDPRVATNVCEYLVSYLRSSSFASSFVVSSAITIGVFFVIIGCLS